MTWIGKNDSYLSRKCTFVVHWLFTSQIRIYDGGKAYFIFNLFWDLDGMIDRYLIMQRPIFEVVFTLSDSLPLRLSKKTLRLGAHLYLTTGPNDYEDSGPKFSIYI